MGSETPPDPSPDDGIRHAARLVLEAARSLAGDAAGGVDRFGPVASHLSAVIEAGPSRAEILAKSPYVIERSGRARTIVEMIEHEAGDDESRLRLARLLLRALTWEPAGSGPRGPGSRLPEPG